MSNPSRQKYIKRNFFITPEQDGWIDTKASARDPERATTRMKSPVLRDVIDFAKFYEPLFLHFVATREQNTTGGND